MAGKNKTDSESTRNATREERLKVALKANLARRKAQSRSRAAKADAPIASASGSEQEKDT
jgi:hypothetical protein